LISVVGNANVTSCQSRASFPSPTCHPFGRPDVAGNELKQYAVSKQEPIDANRREFEVEVVAIIRTQHEPAVVD
jgi:hypothetical protein